MADWYYAKDGQQFGPINSQQLKHLAATGGLVPDDLVFREGSKDWVAASTVQGLFPAGGAVAKAPAAKPRPAAGGEFGIEETATAAPSAERPIRAAREPVAAVVESEEVPAGSIGDLLAFRRMIAPTIIIVLFWLGIASAVLAGLGVLISGVFMLSVSVPLALATMLGGILLIPIAVLYVRLLSEAAIVLFRINETLSDMRELLRRQAQK